MDRIRLAAFILLVAFLLLRLSIVPPESTESSQLATATATATVPSTWRAGTSAATDASTTAPGIGAATTTASEPSADSRLSRCQPGLPTTALTPSLEPHALHALQAARDEDLSAIALDRVFSDKQYRRWPGVNINATSMLHFARDVIAPYRHEFAQFNEFPPCGVGPSGKHKRCLDSSRFQGSPEYTYYRNNGMYEGTCPVEVRVPACHHPTVLEPTSPLSPTTGYSHPTPAAPFHHSRGQTKADPRGGIGLLDPRERPRSRAERTRSVVPEEGRPHDHRARAPPRPERRVGQHSVPGPDQRAREVA